MKLLSRTFHSFYNSIKFTYNTETFLWKICTLTVKKKISIKNGNRQQCCSVGSVGKSLMWVMFVKTNMIVMSHQSD